MPPTQIHTLSLHDALPILNTQAEPPPKRGMGCFAKSCLMLIVLAVLLVAVGVGGTFWGVRRVYLSDKPARSEEHTSELQSLTNLVCRLLLEKKKKNITT